MSKFISKQKKLLISISAIVLFFICLFVFILKKPFLLGNDQWFQYNIFYKEWIRLIIEFIKGNGLPMYSWNMYLGTDFYSAMGYYCTGDIFLPLLLLFRNNVELGLLIETILCVYIAAVTMNIFLEKYNVENENIRVFISIIYAIGGQASQFVGNYMFYRFYAFMPLLFIGLLNYFKDKKVKTFIVATAILLLQSYYLMFPTLIFLFMFSLMLEIKMKKDIKIIFKDFFILLGCLIVGFMISAIITLPSIMYLLNNPRVGANDGGLLWPLNTYVGLFMSLISFNPIETGFDIFQNLGQAHDYQFTLFITIIPLLSCIKYIIKKENKSDFVLFCLLLIFLCIKPLSSIMHGFSGASFRWTFIVVFYLLILASREMDSLKIKETRKLCLFYFVLYISLFVLLSVTGYVHKGNLIHIFIIFISLIWSLIIVFVFDTKRYLAIILSIIEIVAFQSYYFYLQTSGAENFAETIDVKEMEYVQSIDEDVVYRYYYSYLNNLPNSVLNQNKSLDYRFMSVSSYNSLNDSYIGLFNELAENSYGLDWILYVEDPYANTMLGVKYYIVYKDKELPKELNFEYAYNLDYLEVYRNLDYKGFGYTASNLKYTKDFDTTKDFYDYILVDDDSYDLDKYQNIKETKLNIIERYNNHFLADINLEEDNILLIPIPNNNGWRVKVNDEFVNTISVNGGFIGIELNKGYNKIEMNFTSPYFKEGAILSFLGIISFGTITSIDIVKKRKNII